MVTAKKSPAAVAEVAPKVKAAAKKTVAAPVAAVAPAPAVKKAAAKKTVSAPVAAAVPAPAVKKAAAKKATPAKVTVSAAPTRPAVTAEQRHNYIEVAAFYVAQRRGFAPGNPIDDWATAEQEVDRLIDSGHFSK